LKKEKALGPQTKMDFTFGNNETVSVFKVGLINYLNTIFKSSEFETSTNFYLTTTKDIYSVKPGDMFSVIVEVGEKKYSTTVSVSTIRPRQRRNNFRNITYRP
jgi:hypothetical protein